jgi:hypothetical protein
MGGGLMIIDLLLLKEKMDQPIIEEEGDAQPTAVQALNGESVGVEVSVK